MNVALQWLLLALGCFVITHTLTSATLPPLAAARRWLIHRATGDWADLYTCPYCCGFYVSIIAVVVTSLVIPVPLPLLQILGCWAVTGFLGDMVS